MIIIHYLLLCFFTLCNSIQINNLYSNDLYSIDSISGKSSFKISRLILSSMSSEEMSSFSYHSSMSNERILSFSYVSYSDKYSSHKSCHINSDSYSESIYNNFSFSYMHEDDDIKNNELFDIEIDMNVNGETTTTFTDPKQFTLRYVFSELLFTQIENVEIISIRDVDLNAKLIINDVYKMDIQNGINIFMVTRFTSNRLVDDVINQISQIFINGILESKLNDYGMNVDLTLNSVNLYNPSNDDADDSIDTDDDMVIELTPEKRSKTNNSRNNGIIIGILLTVGFCIIFVYSRKRGKRFAKFFSSVVPEMRNT